MYDFQGLFQRFTATFFRPIHGAAIRRSVTIFRFCCFSLIDVSILGTSFLHTIDMTIYQTNGQSNNNFQKNMNAQGFSRVDS